MRARYAVGSPWVRGLPLDVDRMVGPRSRRGSDALAVELAAHTGADDRLLQKPSRSRSAGNRNPGTSRIGPAPSPYPYRPNTPPSGEGSLASRARVGTTATGLEESHCG